VLQFVGLTLTVAKMLPVFSCGLACVCFVKANCYPRKPAQCACIVVLTSL